MVLRVLPNIVEHPGPRYRPVGLLDVGCEPLVYEAEHLRGVESEAEAEEVKPAPSSAAVGRPIVE